MVWPAALALGGKALLYGGTALGIGGTVAGLASMPEEARRKAVEQGPDAFGRYKVDNPLLRPFVAEENTADMDVSRAQYLNRNDPEVSKRTTLGIRPIKPGETVQQYKSATQVDYDKAVIDKKIDEESQIDRARWNSPESQWNREQAQSREAWQRSQVEWNNAETARQFDNNLAQARQTRIENLELQRDKLGLGRLELQMNQDRAMYEAETRRQDRKEKRTSALIQALAGLGAAFAI